MTLFHSMLKGGYSMFRGIKIFANRIFSLIKLSVIIFIALITPRFFLFYSPPSKTNEKNKIVELPITDPKFNLGLENISDKLLKKLYNNGKPLKIGLITNQTGIDQSGNRNIDILLKKGLSIKAIYAPEHGFEGISKAGRSIEDTTDEKTKIPIISLYVGDSVFRKFTKNDLKNIDVLIFDIQDSGTRHYTYISILYKMMEVAAEFDKHIIVLDRPNPLGYIMEGPLVNSKNLSFVSIAPIPIRHALTVGELARYFNKYRLKKQAQLTIVPMKGYSRTRGLNGFFPKPLSPNINNLQSCICYSFTGILSEIKLFDVGMNTDKAFQYILLPERINFPLERWYELRKILNVSNIDSILSKFIRSETGEKFIGLKLNIRDINEFSSINTLIKILSFFKDAGIQFNYTKIFNKLSGTEEFHYLIERKITKFKFAQKTNKDLQKFYDQVKDLLIYQPFPKIIEIEKA